ncbi:MAG: hypothetical protein ACOY35_11225 [Bacillota bacterium]
MFKGPVYFLDEPMAPSGDKLVLRQGPQPIEVFTTNEPHWQIYRWSRKTHPGLTKIIWSRDGNSLLALKSSPSKSKAYPYVLAFYRPDGKELNEIPFSNFIKYVKEIKFGPEGTTIYAHTEHHGKMQAIDMYDLKDPQSGWRTLVTSPDTIFEWEVGPGGLLVYNHYAEENGYYNYIFSSSIELRGLWLYQKDMERPIRLTGYADRVLAISPDGNTILFGRERPDPRSSQYPIQSDIMQLTRSRN